MFKFLKRNKKNPASRHPRKKRTSSRIAFFILGVGVIAISLIYLFFKAKTVEAGWYNDAWTYRSSVSVSNATGSTLTDFQVKLTVDSDTLTGAGKLQNDCDDLRFTDSTGVNILPYWIEDSANASDAVTCNAADVDVWVRVTSIPSAGATIYMYYGNASATTGSSGASTFPFFDGFTGASLNSTTWATPTGAVSVANGEATITTGAIYTNSSILAGSQNYIYEHRTKWTTTTGSYAGLIIGEDQDIIGGNAGTDKLVMLMTTSIASYQIQGFGADGTTTGYNITSATNQYVATASTYHVSGFSLDSTNLRFYNNRTQTNSYTGTWSAAPYLYLGYFYGSTGGTSDIKDMTSDWVIARKYASSVPATAVGSEESKAVLVSYWSFDEGNGTTANDLTGVANGTLTNGPVWGAESDCLSGRCLYFDGTDDYVALGNISNYKVASKTISFWARPSGPPSVVTPVFSSSGANWYTGFSNSGNGLMHTSYSIGAGTQSTVASSAVVKPNEWHMYTYVYTLSGTNVIIDMYMDGVLVRTNTASTGYGGTYGTAFIIGAFNSSSLFYKGYLDEVKIYNNPLTVTEIKQEYTARGAAMGSGVQIGSGGSISGQNLSNGLVAYYPADEEAANSCPGGTSDTCDKSGNVNDIAWNVNDPDIVQGKFGKGLDFETTNSDYGTIVDNASLSVTGSLTLSAWFKLESLANGGLISKDGGSGDRSYYLAIQSSKVRFAVSPSGTSVVYKDTNTTLTTGVWYHVIGTFDSTKQTMSVYLNGVLDETAITGTLTNAVFDSTSNVSLGHAPNNGYMDGVLDEARIYSRSFNFNDAAALYGFSPSPVLAWPFDEGTGSSVNDSSNNNNTGTMSNGPLWSSGRLGNGITFDGSNDAVTIATASDSSVDFNGTEMFSAGAWVYITSMPGSGHRDAIITKYDQTNSLRAYRLFVTNDDADTTGNFQVDIYDESDDRSIGAVGANDTVVENTWYYVAFSFNGGTAGAAGDLKLYTNGGLTGSNTLNTNFLGLEDVAVDFTVGDYASADVIANNTAFTGIIDAVSVYPYILNQKNIRNLMNGRAVSDSAVGSPVGHPDLYWKFDEGTGTTAYDSGTMGNNGTLGGTGSPVWKTDGKFNKAIDFTATAGPTYTKVTGSPVNLGTTTGDQLTLSMWMKPDATQVNSAAMFVRNGSSTDGNYYSYFDSSSGGFYRILTGWHNGTGFTGAIASGYIVPASVWSQLTIVFTQGVNIKYYVNGVLRSTVAMGSNSVSATTGFNIGGHAGSSAQAFDGYLDEIKVYKYGLTQEEINMEYNYSKSVFFGSLSTTSDGRTADNSSDREFCVPGDTTSCSGPIYEWKMDENTSTTINSTGTTSNAGTLTGGPTWDTGKQGSSVKFDGTDDYIDIGNVGGNTNFTYSLWFNTTSAATSQLLVQTDDILIQLTNLGAFNYTAWNGRAGTGAARAATVGTVVADSWQHLAITGAGSSSFALYLNGVLISTTHSADTPSNSYTDDRLGVILPDAGSPTRYFTGKLDSLRVYNYVRTPAQIAWEYNQGGPIAEYKFDECENTTTYNSVKGANDAPLGLNGTLTVGSSGTNTSVGTCIGGGGEAWADGAVGRNGSSIEFDGTDDYVSIADDPLLSPGDQDYSVSAWVKNSTDNSSTAWIFSNYGSSTNNIFGVYLNSSTEAAGCNIRDNSGNLAAMGSTKALNDGVWHHVACVLNGNNGYLYIDGVLGGTVDTSAVGTINTTGRSKTIGTYAVSVGSQNLTGQIDEVRVYRYALTSAQVRDIFNNGVVTFR
jgi:hypothetical protein